MAIFKGIINGTPIESSSFLTLKAKASKVANKNFNAVDELLITHVDGTDYENPIRIVRINKKYPNNTIERGKWS